MTADEELPRSPEPDPGRDPLEERLDSLYARLKPLPQAEREALIDAECAGEPDVAGRLRRMLAPGPPTGFLVPPTAGENAERFFGGALEGETLGGFTLVRELGRGAMGVVYLAEQHLPRRNVALKVLPAAHAQDPLRAERFRREAEAASRIEHPNVVPILAYGAERGQLWYAMRYVDGHDLHEELARHRKLRAGQPTPLPLLPPYDGPDYVGRVVERFVELLDALQCAHENHVVHRDVKPQNILVDGEGRLQLADFGLARDDRFGSLTQAGQVQGTPNYMSPEQARVLEHQVDHRTDVYSAAVVLYEVLGLQRAFTGATEREIFAKIGTSEPLPLARIARRVPRDLEVICETGMAKRPERRYSSAREFADDLRRFLGHEAIHARPPSVLERAARVARRHRVPLLAGGAAVLALWGGMGIAGERRFREVVAGDEARLAPLVAEAEWSGRLAELVIARRRVLELRASGRQLPREFASLVARFEGRLEEHKVELVRRGTELVERGLEGRPIDVPPAVRDAHGVGHPSIPLARASGRDEGAIAAGLALLQSAATLYWDDPRLAELAAVERTWPRVSVELPEDVLRRAARASEARAYARRVDPIAESFGAPIELGFLPVRDARLAPGYYRIVVEIPEFGFGEYARYLGVGDPRPVVTAWVRADAEATQGLRRFQGGEYRYRVGTREKSGLGCSEAHEAVELAPYWIGEAETSNAEVVEYLRATGAHPPKFWWDLGWRNGPEDLELGAELERWFELPAVGFSGEFARAFAEWRGARLPTHPELERAHRGLDARFYPWGDELPMPDGFLCNLGRVGTRPTHGRQRLLDYLAGVLPVRAPGYAQPPETLFHTFGNVAEWTESLVPVAHGGILECDPQERLAMGLAWYRDVSEGSLSNHNLRSIDPRHLTFDTGIRLAKSVRP